MLRCSGERCGLHKLAVPVFVFWVGYQRGDSSKHTPHVSYMLRYGHS